MFEFQNRIIIVDNEESELDYLGKSFLKSGIGCKTFNYNELIAEPLSHVRIAFFDINLMNKSVDLDSNDIEELVKRNSSVLNDLATALSLYISKDNGPYALIFWTSNPKLKEAFIHYVQDSARGFSSLPSPFYIDCLDKIELSNNDGLLSEKVLAILSNDKIKFLFDFEHKARISGEKTINKIYDIIPKDEKWGESKLAFDNLGKVLSKIAISTLGFKHSKVNPSKAVYEGILPMLNNELVSIESDVNWNLILEPLYATENQNEIKFPSEIIQRKVNTIFHLDTLSNISLETRGAVFEYNFHVSFAQKVILSLFPYFSKIEKEMNKRFNSFFSFNETASEDTKNRIRGNSKFVVIELSASCDYSQNKSRNNKYILGLLTPIIDKKILDLENSSNSLFYKDLPDFIYEGVEYNIWLNLNYIISDFEINKNIGNPLFIFKKELMDMIGNRYANHISRIGITSF